MDPDGLYEDIKEQTNFYLKCLLLTSPGENISDARYGVGLRSYLFEMNIPQTHERIVAEIRKQVGFYIPIIELVDVIILADDLDIDQNSLVVKIIYRIEDELIDFDVSVDPTKEIGFY